MERDIFVNQNNNLISKSGSVNGKYFDKRKILVILTWSIVMIILIIVVIKFVIDLDFNSLFSFFGRLNPQNDYLIIAIVGAIVFFVFSFFQRIFPY